MLKPEEDQDFDIDTIDSVRFENVSFGYGRKKVLKNMSFNIKSGDTALLLGDSGKGKVL